MISNFQLYYYLGLSGCNKVPGDTQERFMKCRASLNNGQIFKMHFIFLLQEIKANRKLDVGKGGGESCI